MTDRTYFPYLLILSAHRTPMDMWQFYWIPASVNLYTTIIFSFPDPFFKTALNTWYHKRYHRISRFRRHQTFQLSCSYQGKYFVRNPSHLVKVLEPKNSSVWDFHRRTLVILVDYQHIYVFIFMVPLEGRFVWVALPGMTTIYRCFPLLASLSLSLVLASQSSMEIYP